MRASLRRRPDRRARTTSARLRGRQRRAADAPVASRRASRRPSRRARRRSAPDHRTHGSATAAPGEAAAASVQARLAASRVVPSGQAVGQQGEGQGPAVRVDDVPARADTLPKVPVLRATSPATDAVASAANRSASVPVHPATGRPVSTAEHGIARLVAGCGREHLGQEPGRDPVAVREPAAVEEAQPGRRPGRGP